MIAISAAAQAELAVRAGGPSASLLCLTLTASIVVSVLTDLATGYVLDAVTFSGICVALLLSAYAGTFGDAAVGASGVAGSLFILYIVSRGQGLGLGDVKLAGCVGALCGLTDGLISLAIAFVLGGAHALALLLTRRGTRKTAVPFAPYLAAGAAVELFLNIS